MNWNSPTQQTKMEQDAREAKQHLEDAYRTLAILFWKRRNRPIDEPDTSHVLLHEKAISYLEKEG